MLTLRFAGPAERAPDDPTVGSAAARVWLDRHGGIVARGFRDAGSCWMVWPRLATYRFAAGDPFITAHPMGGAPHDVIWDVYRRSVLPLAMQVLGWEALHASAIVGDAGIVLFCAVSETGKSTMAFALRQREFPQWADDGVVFRMDGAAIAVPLPFEARLRLASRAIFGDAARSRPGFAGNGAGEQRHTEPRPVSSICLLNRVPGEGRSVPRIARLAGAEAFPAVLVHAHEFDPDDQDRRARMIRTYLDLVATVPVFEVSFVPDRSRIGELCSAIVDSLGLEAPAASLGLAAG